MTETVVVVGAGIAGLCSALALGRSDRQVVIVERDGPPPAGGADEAFHDWKRTGVGHLRQSHAFLARLRNIIRQDHPQLLDDLAAAGVRDLTFQDMLTDQQRESYEPKPQDAELTIITSRRTTLELVLRRYVEALPNVTLRPGIFVRRLQISRRPDGLLQATGVRADENGREVEIQADVVVDAGGKGADLIDQLREAGAQIPEFTESAGILYFTRHYRLRPGRSEPPRTGAPPASGDLGFLKFGVFPADNGCFSITVCAPEIEYEMRKAIMKPEVFQEITMLLPGLRRWTNPDQAEPTSKVFGMGDLLCRWRDLVVDGAPAALGYFAIGDNLARTNPLYGRGCSFAAVAASRLREALDGSQDPATRARAYHDAVREDLRPFFDLMLKQDRDAIKRAHAALTPGHRPSFRARLAKSFAEDGIAVAVRQDVELLRQAMRGFHMLEHPEAWLKRPGNLARVLRSWARGKARNAAAYPPKAGPGREEMMRALGLDHEADVRLAAQAQIAA
ncbi:FAD-dependent oxidoreductase [Phenylobacterium sp.]|jgi:2-polyprenyl-6-methoxyphenol hydroxylase-like FAD-dependent oxidoreductase|uniref:FAD-dependent oxidoreductase n=1 Tax=Phenylobacterium sp. TaxID=1871053 RepID=UPI002F3E659B